MDTESTNGKTIKGVYIIINDWSQWHPTELAFAMMELTARWEHPSPFENAKKSEINLFNKHVGSTSWWNYLSKGGSSIDYAHFLQKWDLEVKNFRRQTERFLLY